MTVGVHREKRGHLFHISSNNIIRSAVGQYRGILKGFRIHVINSKRQLYYRDCCSSEFYLADQISDSTRVDVDLIGSSFDFLALSASRIVTATKSFLGRRPHSIVHRTVTSKRPIGITRIYWFRSGLPVALRHPSGSARGPVDPAARRAASLSLSCPEIIRILWLKGLLSRLGVGVLRQPFVILFLVFLELIYGQNSSSAGAL